MAKGYKVEYENQNQEEIPHWDVATNIDINNDNNSIPSTNLQDAIDYLAENTNRVLLSSFEGYEDIATDEVTEHPTLAGCGIATAITFNIYRLSTEPINWDNEKVANDINPRYWCLVGASRITSPSNLPNTISDFYIPYVYGPSNTPTVDNYLNYRIFFPSTNDNEVKVTINDIEKPYIEGTIFSASDIATINSQSTVTLKNSKILEIYNNRIKQAKRVADDASTYTVRANPYGILYSQQGELNTTDCWTKKPSDETLANVDNETLYLYTSQHTYSDEDGSYREYSNPILVEDVSTLPVQIENTQAWREVQLQEVRRQWTEYYDRADATREFIQNAINFVQNIHNGVLVFPKNKYFLVSIPTELGIALNVTKKISIDFNGSTIQAASHCWTESDILQVEPNSEYPTVDGSVFKNGILLGDRDTHFIMPGNKATKPEHDHAVSSKGLVVFENMKVGKVTGDGFNVNGVTLGFAQNAYDSDPRNRTKVLATYSYGALNSNGQLIAQDGWWTSPTRKVSAYCPNANYALVVGVQGDTDAAGYTINPLCTVTFFSNVNAVLAQVKVRWYDLITIKDSYYSFAVSFETSLLEVDKTQLKVIHMSGVHRSYFPRLENCESFECGRNGMCLTSAKKITVKGCIVHDFGGTNNNVGIDIEGQQNLDGDIEIEDTDVYNIAGNNVGAGISGSTGKRISLIDCNFNTAAGFKYSNIIIENCQFSKSLSFYNLDIYNQIHPRRIVRNSVMYGSVSGFGVIFENCVFYGNVTREGTDSSKSNIVKNTYRHCTFYGEILPGDYENCTFYTKNLVLRPYNLFLSNYYDKPNIFKFEYCRFSCKTIAANYDVYYTIADFINCHLELSNTAGNNITKIQIRKFENNVVEVNRVVTSANSSNPIFGFRLSNVTTIKNNTFKPVVNGALKGILFNVIFDNRAKTGSDPSSPYIEYNITSQVVFENNYIIPTDDVTLIHITRPTPVSIDISNNATGHLFVKNNVILANNTTDVNRCDNDSSSYAPMYFEDNDYYNAASVTNAVNNDIHITNLNIGPSSEQIGN